MPPYVGFQAPLRARASAAATTALAFTLLLAATVVILAAGTGPAAAAGPSASLEQCQNGTIGPPISPEPCVGSNLAAVSAAISGINGGTSTSYKNWQSGNANGAKSHWREGDFVAYRVDVGGINSGSSHTLALHFDTVTSGHHAFDYLGSYDATETTSSAPTASGSTIINANNANPCSDLVSSGDFPWPCTPTTPQASMAFPAVQMTGAGGKEGCGSSPGTFSGAQMPGAIDLFGPAGSTIDGVTYPSQNVASGANNCYSDVNVTFTVPENIATSDAIVFAWGSHIASEQDWGIGNAAATISGSSFHMALDTLDGSSVGSEDAQLATSAIYFTPSISTVVYDNGAPMTGTVSLGDSVYDTAAFADASAQAGGTVTYSRYANLTCSGTPVTETVTVTNAATPHSTAFTPLAGDYSYKAVYSGDARDLAATSSCEPFSVAKNSTTIATTVFDAATDTPVTTSVALDATVYDTATITRGAAGPTPTGTVTYTFYAGGSCTTGTAVGTPQVVTVNADGTVPNSANHGPLTAADGPYAFQVSYSGDGNYLGGSSDCEPFSVQMSIASVTTVVYNAATSAPVSGALPLDATVYDTSAIAHPAGAPAPTGTVTYTFYAGGSCTTGTAVGTPQVVTVNADGTVPNSANHGPLTAADGPYAFQATYSGDGNYVGGASDCEPFDVGQGIATVATVIYAAATNQPLTASVGIGSSVCDTATVSHSESFEPTGTLTYTFYKSGACTTGSAVGTPQVVTVSGGTVPNSATQGPLTAADGPYAFQATYSGDGNYVGGASDCEPFGVAKGDTSLATTIHDATTGAVIGAMVPLDSHVYDSASLTHSSDVLPTGTVTFTFYSTGDCTTGVLFETPEVVDLDAVGSVPNSSIKGQLTASESPYAFQASYSGDANYVSAVSPCEPFETAKATTSVTTTIYDATTGKAVTSALATGATVYDSAAISRQNLPAPTGKVTYTFYKSGTCTTGTVVGTPEVVDLASDGSLPDSAKQGPLAAGGGPYAFQATYSGDGNYIGGPSTCEELTISRATPTVTTRLSATAVEVGTPLHDAATLQGATSGAAGTVTFTAYSDNACTNVAASIGTVAVTSGTVPDSPSFFLSAAGTYYIQAAYSGDADNAPATSACSSEIVTVSALPVGAPQTGVAATGLGTGGRLLLGGVLFLLGALAVGIAVLLRRRRARVG
ncbi:MAG: hypothetical protein M0020_02725 [Actinomycetota bacterium]|nr:hypothetical protein [Actinomycetota bacterium]